MTLPAPTRDLQLQPNSTFSRSLLGWVGVWRPVQNLRLEGYRMKYYDPTYDIDCEFEWRHDYIDSNRVTISNKNPIIFCKCTKRSNGANSPCVFSVGFYRYKCWGSILAAVYYNPIAAAPLVLPLNTPPPYSIELEADWCV